MSSSKVEVDSFPFRFYIYWWASVLILCIATDLVCRHLEGIESALKGMKPHAASDPVPPTVPSK